MTARAQTEIEAANLALGHLGQAAIADLADDNIRARAARQFFGAARDAILREKWWSFAKGWDKPAADVAQSLGPIKGRYPMPADCVRIRYLDDGRGTVFDEKTGAWDIEAGQITIGDTPIESMVLVTDITAPLVAYTKRIETVRLWDPVFLLGFSYELAAMAAFRLARSRTLGEALHTRAMTAIESAAAIDSKESSGKDVPRSSSWVLARSGFRTPAR